MSNEAWVKTSERLPKRKDAGYFRDVIVLFRKDYRVIWPEKSTELLPFHLVRKTFHSHWMAQPEPPPEESK